MTEMRAELSRKQRLVRWGLAVVWIAAGIAFAWAGTRLFDAWGLPVWSDGDHGWNYVGVTAFVILTAGISVFNSTLSQKVRLWIWAVVIGLFFVLTSDLLTRG